MVANTVVGAIELASQVTQAASSVANSEAVKVLQNRSLIDVASVARVEPILLVDGDCLLVEATPDAVQAMHSMFAGYYLQAVNMVNTVGEVTVAQRLAPFNPNTGAVFEELAADARRAYSMEDFKFKLPTRADLAKKIALEDSKPDPAFQTIQEAASLSVGKLFNVRLQCGEQSIAVPVSVRLMAHTVPSRVMAELFTNQDVFDQNLKERYHAWRAGRISFWKDLVLCNDLIDKRVKSSIHDKSGILNVIRQRQSGNNMNTALAGKASVSNATNLAILTSDTMEGVETQLGGSMKNAKIRRAVFDSTNLMIVAVMDKRWERVTFWFRGLDANTNVSFKDLKSASKGDGSNVTDILKAYISGAAPSL